MKKLLFIALLMPLGLMAQKKATHIQKPHISRQHDSTYYTVEADTTYGTIEYSVNGGKVISKGMIRHWQVFEWLISVPIDTSNIFGGLASGTSDGLNNHKDAYIWYQGHWKLLDYDTRFIFKPDEN